MIPIRIRLQREGTFLRRRAGLGFTLMELLVVLVILGLLATLVIRNVAGRIPQAKVETVKTQMREFENALDEYKLDNGYYPSTEQGMAALVSPPTTGNIPKNYPEGGYMKRIPNDPWGNDYVYELQTTPREHYVVMSYGRDGREGGEGEDKDLINTEMFKD